jgi:hypothetical protein
MRAIIRLASCLLLVCYENAAAQLGFLDKVFSNVTNINAYLLLGRSLGTSDLAAAPRPAPRSLPGGGRGRGDRRGESGAWRYASSSRAMAAARRAQPVVSSFSCFRPRAVRR